MRRYLALTGLFAPFLGATAAPPPSNALCTGPDRACLIRTTRSYFDAILKADGSAVPFAAMCA